MRPLLSLTVAALLNVIISASSAGGGSNIAPLQGAAPVGFNVLPNLPPKGFFAWCETPRGLCLVQGQAPIAPASLCHCAEFAGRTA